MSRNGGGNPPPAGQGAVIDRFSGVTRVRKTGYLLGLFGVIALTLAAGEATLWLAGFPNGIQIHESDLRAYDDDLVYRLRPDATLEGKRTPYFVHPAIHTNSMGFRDHEFVLPKPAGTFRVLSLGDSYAFGWGVALEETYAKRLEHALRTDAPAAHAEVLNAGVPSYESWRELRVLERTGPVLDPDLVLCQVADNDLGEEGAGWKHADLRLPAWGVRAGRSSRLVTLAITLVSSGLEGLRELRARGAGADTVARSDAALTAYMRGLAEENDSSFTRNEPWTEGIVRNYVRMNELAHGAFLCLLVPNRYQSTAEGYHESALTILATRLTRQGVRAINLCAYLRAHRGEPLTLADTHPNARGHQLIADTLAQYLRETGLFPPRRTGAAR